MGSRRLIAVGFPHFPNIKRVEYDFFRSGDCGKIYFIESVKQKCENSKNTPKNNGHKKATCGIISLRLSLNTLFPKTGGKNGTTRI